MTDRQKYRELYWCWKAVKQRCLNPRCHAYRNYGGRGIGVCSEWMEFEPFLAWALSHGWEKGLDIDRTDNDGDYTPSNCRFVTRRENINNRRKTILVEVDGETKPISYWADVIGCKRGTIKSWALKHGVEYAAQRIADAIENGYTPHNYSYGHTKPVMHVESGLRFGSYRDAAKHFGISRPTFNGWMYRGGNTRIGHFVVLEES